jgi:hypothetical protein
MFEKLDTDGNGDITLSEIEAAPQELADELARCFQTDDIIELFEILDIEQRGRVSIREFCAELVNVIVSDHSVEQVRTQKSMLAIRSHVHELRQEMVLQKAENEAMRADISKILGLLAPQRSLDTQMSEARSSNDLLRPTLLESRAATGESQMTTSRADSYSLKI